MRVACAQLALVIGDAAGNRERGARAIERAARTGANMVVLPELCNSGYVFADAAEARSLAEPLDGPTITVWRELSACYGIVTVGGICERGEGGHLSNTAVTIDNGVVVSVYRKTHLWDREQRVFSPGSTPAPVVPTTLGPIGVAICYDAFFPEVMRTLALDGALLIAVPMNTPVVEPVLAPLAAEIVLAIAAATCNRVFVAQCDRTGQERGVSWVEASAIVGPDGRLLAAQEAGEALLVAEVDLAEAEDKRVGSGNDVLGDRRPELYRTLRSAAAAGPTGRVPAGSSPAGGLPPAR